LSIIWGFIEILLSLALGEWDDLAADHLGFNGFWTVVFTDTFSWDGLFLRPWDGDWSSNDDGSHGGEDSEDGELHFEMLCFGYVLYRI